MRKRNIALLLVLIVILASCLAACNSPKQIDGFYKKLEKADSATMVIEMQTFLGKFLMTYKTEGNKTYSSASFDEDEKYTETVDGKVYVYQKNLNGRWTKTLSTEEEEEAVPGITELFSSENYTYSKDLKKFVLKEGVNPEFLDGLVSDTLTLEISDGICVLNGEIQTDGLGLVMPFTITIKDLNKTVVTLPQVA
ncbi:MAG TPA: hypothetical protein PKY53_00915 [Clostridia bacterium]|nr:hypothetical protein [Clostridia bacterium]